MVGKITKTDYSDIEKKIMSYSNFMLKMDK